MHCCAASTRQTRIALLLNLLASAYGTRSYGMAGPRQVAEFNTPEFWPGEVFLDNDKVFYAAVGGGQVNSLSLTQLLNPFGKAMKNMSRASKTVKNHNLKVRERMQLHLTSHS